MDNRIAGLCESCFGMLPGSEESLGGSAGGRLYSRLRFNDRRTVIATVGSDLQENLAFFALASHFKSKGLNVPGVLARSRDGMCYLQEDLGGESLYSRLAPCRDGAGYGPQDREVLKTVVRELVRLQFEGGKGLDWSVCHPQKSFDGRMVDFDLNYFKYDYLKLTGTAFDELALQDDFDRLREDILASCGIPLASGEDFSGETFLHRDFQSRNIMLRGDRPWFIDFQGGRKGPVYYDLASFIGQTRAAFPEEIKAGLTEVFIDALQERTGEIDRILFRRRLGLFTLLRMLQTLGCYGFRGLWERKRQFMEVIPAALSKLDALAGEVCGPYPCLGQVLKALASPVRPEGSGTAVRDCGLKIKLCSFSFKKGLPEDGSGNGGGYVFDCRGLHNPGRYERYKALTGKDAEVAAFLLERSGAEEYLYHVFALIDGHIENYIGRGFTSLMISFGCTGGRHRSVYCAERTAAHIREKFGIEVAAEHRELSREPGQENGHAAPETQE